MYGCVSNVCMLMRTSTYDFGFAYLNELHEVPFSGIKNFCHPLPMCARSSDVSLRVKYSLADVLMETMPCSEELIGLVFVFIPEHKLHRTSVTEATVISIGNLRKAPLLGPPASYGGPNGHQQW